MAIKLYDLAGANPELRFSPFCWRIRMALAHKGLAVETTPWRFTDKPAIAATGQGLVPVIEDGAMLLHDSWAIATYLEDTYPDRPSLFGGPGGRAMARFIGAWADSTVHLGVARCVVKDIWEVLDPKDQPYFRESREKRFGMSLEAFVANRAATVKDFRASLGPLRFTLGKQPYLGGEAPNYADYIVFGAFMWARNVSDFPLLEADDPVHAWRGRLLAAFDGLAGRSLGYEV
jgi:glutathione S-transferase